MSDRFESEQNKEDVFAAMEPGEPYTAPELAEKTGIPRRTVLKYLNGLYEDDRVKRKKTGHRSVIWLLKDE